MSANDKLYINSISVANAYKDNGAVMHLQTENADGYLSPGEKRRVSKILQNGYISAKKALTQAGCAQPDLILTATSLGCMDESEKFWQTTSKKLIGSPTAFINSTPNALAGLIARKLNAHVENFTILQRAFSVEAALNQAFLFDKNAILIGAYDEATQVVKKTFKKMGFFRTHAKLSELAAFLVCSGAKSKKSIAAIGTPHIFFKGSRYALPNKDFLNTIENTTVAMYGVSAMSMEHIKALHPTHNFIEVNHTKIAAPCDTLTALALAIQNKNIPSNFSLLRCFNNTYWSIINCQKLK